MDHGSSLGNGFSRKERRHSMGSAQSEKAGNDKKVVKKGSMWLADLARDQQYLDTNLNEAKMEQI